jgi:hypothetical protein
MEQYTEAQLLDGIFSSERVNHLVRNEWLGGKFDLEAFRGIPATELDLAQEICKFVGTNVIYVKSEAAWYIWYGNEYRKTEGDWLAHKIIKRTAHLFGDLADEVFTHCRTLDKAGNEDSGKATDQFSHLQTVSTKLHSASALDAYTKLLKTELDTIPEGMVKDTPFLTIDYLAERVALPHLVQDHIPSVGIGQLYGQSSAGKTIAVVDLALSICAGLKTWQGLPLNLDGPQQILYIAAEGGQPFWDMVNAWKVKHPEVTKEDLAGFIVWDAGIGQTLTIGTSLEVAPGLFGLVALKDKVQAAGLKPAMVVFDPQANILSGVDENSNVEMVAALKPIQDWASEGQFLALLIHHEGKKDSGSGRGASSQKAMMDLLIKLTKNADNTRTLSFEKVKGSKDPDRKLNYTIETMEFSGGSGSGGVAVPAGARLSIKERAERLGALDISKVQHAIKSGATSSSGIEKATGIGRNKVSDYLKELQAKGIIQNLGGDTRPRWTLISPDYEEPAA